MKFTSTRLLVVFRSQRKQLVCATAAAAWLILCPVFALAHGDLDQRIQGLSLELAKDATQAELWLKRASLYRQHGELAAALSDVREALQLKPDWPAAQLQLARILLDLQRHAPARVAADVCLARDPGNPDALVIRSRCYTHLGDTNAAISDLSAVLAGGDRPQPDLYLERAHLQVAQGLWMDAVNGLDEGMERLGKTPSLAFPALDYECKAGEFEAALARLEELQRFMSREQYLTQKARLQAGVEKAAKPTAVGQRDPSAAP